MTTHNEPTANKHTDTHTDSYIDGMMADEGVGYFDTVAEAEAIVRVAACAAPSGDWSAAQGPGGLAGFLARLQAECDATDRDLADMLDD